MNKLPQAFVAFAENSYSVPEVRISLKHNLTSISPFVLSPENDRVDNHNRDDQKIARNTSPNTWSVVWLVLVPKDCASSDTTDSTETDQSCRSKRTFPLSSDVVGLIRHDCWDSTVTSGTNKEGADIASGSTLSISLFPSVSEACKEQRVRLTSNGSPMRPRAAVKKSKGPRT